MPQGFLKGWKEREKGLEKGGENVKEVMLPCEIDAASGKATYQKKRRVRHGTEKVKAKVKPKSPVIPIVISIW